MGHEGCDPPGAIWAAIQDDLVKRVVDPGLAWRLCAYILPNATPFLIHARLALHRRRRFIKDFSIAVAAYFSILIGKGRRHGWQVLEGLFDTRLYGVQVEQARLLNHPSESWKQGAFLL